MQNLLGYFEHAEILKDEYHQQWDKSRSFISHGVLNRWCEMEELLHILVHLFTTYFDCLPSWYKTYPMCEEVFLLRTQTSIFIPKKEMKCERRFHRDIIALRRRETVSKRCISIYHTIALFIIWWCVVVIADISIVNEAKRCWYVGFVRIFKDKLISVYVFGKAHLGHTFLKTLKISANLLTAEPDRVKFVWRLWLRRRKKIELALGCCWVLFT